MLSFHCMFVQLVSAAASVTPASFFHLQMRLFTVWLNEYTAEKNVSTPAAAGFPSSAFTFRYLHSVWLPVAARWGNQGDKIACPSQTESALVCCQLSPTCWGNHRVVLPGFCLIRQMGTVMGSSQTKGKWTLFFSVSPLLVMQKRFTHAAHSLHQIQIFELFWSLLWYADCLVGEYFNHTRVRYCHFSFHF